MIEEEQLALALKVYTDTALEDRAAWAASFIYDRAPDDVPIFSFLLLFLFYHP